MHMRNSGQVQGQIWRSNVKFNFLGNSHFLGSFTPLTYIFTPPCIFTPTFTPTCIFTLLTCILVLSRNIYFWNSYKIDPGGVRYINIWLNQSQTVSWIKLIRSEKVDTRPKMDTRAQKGKRAKKGTRTPKKGHARKNEHTRPKRYTRPKIDTHNTKLTHTTQNWHTQHKMDTQHKNGIHNTKWTHNTKMAHTTQNGHTQHKMDTHNTKCTYTKI